MSFTNFFGQNRDPKPTKKPNPFQVWFSQKLGYKVVINPGTRGQPQ